MKHMVRRFTHDGLLVKAEVSLSATIDAVQSAFRALVATPTDGASPMPTPWAEEVYADRVVARFPTMAGDEFFEIPYSIGATGDVTFAFDRKRQVRRAWNPLNKARQVAVGGRLSVRKQNAARADRGGLGA